MYAALTPNFYLGKPPFDALLVDKADTAARLVSDGLTVYVTDADTAQGALDLLGLTPDEVTKIMLAATQGISTAYKG